MSWSGRRVLLTGHTGFKGAWLALWLTRLGARVTGFAGAPPTQPSLFELAGVSRDVEDVRGDVRDPAALLRAVAAALPDVVFHLAAQPLVRRSTREPAETMAVNVLGTANLLDALRESTRAEAIVVVTSDKCYARPGSDRAHREEDPLGGADPYSASKAAQELVAASYRDTYGLPIATARAGNVIGGGDWAEDRLIPDLVRAAAAEAPAVIRNPGFVRPWQHVLNPLEGYLRLAERLLEGDDGRAAWNFGPAAADERPVSWVVEHFRARWPSELRVESGPPGGSAEAAGLRLDSSKAHHGLGWSPRWDLETGLAATADWYSRHLAGEDARELTHEQIERFSRPG